MDSHLAVSFVGGFTFSLALAAGMVRPWRGLLLLWVAGVLLGASGMVPGFSPSFVALAAVAGAAALMIAEIAGRYWYRRYKEAILAARQVLAGSLTALILAGIFLSTLWGLLLGGGTGGVGAVYLARRYSLARLAAGLLLPFLRVVALCLPSVLLQGRLLGFF
jgi:hypothetical protein